MTFTPTALRIIPMPIRTNTEPEVIGITRRFQSVLRGARRTVSLPLFVADFLAVCDDREVMERPDELVTTRKTVLLDIPGIGRKTFSSPTPEGFTRFDLFAAIHRTFMDAHQNNPALAGRTLIQSVYRTVDGFQVSLAAS